MLEILFRNEVMSAEEICDVLCIKKETLYSKKWRLSSGIPVYRQGKYLFCEKGAFENWYELRKEVF